MKKLERAEIAPPPDWLEDQVRPQQMLYDLRATITSTGQQNHSPNYAAVCVLIVAREKAQVYKCARYDVGLCMVPCFAEYHTQVNL